MNRKRRLHVGILVTFMLLSGGCSQVIYADGPYRGRVIDGETKKPIEGAAVLAVWRKESGILVPHPIESVHDAQEMLTDKDGNFTIPGTQTVSLNPSERIREPVFTIFKPGYAAYEGWSIKPRSLPRTIRLYEKDGLTVIELGPLRTREEKLENQRKVSVSNCAPQEKCPNLIRLLNIERSNLGLKPIAPKREKSNE